MEKYNMTNILRKIKIRDENHSKKFDFHLFFGFICNALFINVIFLENAENKGVIADNTN